MPGVHTSSPDGFTKMGSLNSNENGCICFFFEITFTACLLSEWFFQKHEDGDDQGRWVFEGRLHLENVILGRWRITGAPDNAHHGIFSLGKSHDSKE